MTDDTAGRKIHESSAASTWEVVYWPTERTCVTYDTREEAVAAVAWYERTTARRVNDRGGRRGHVSRHARPPVCRSSWASRDWHLNAKIAREALDA